MRYKMKIIYFSKGSRGFRCLAYILSKGYDVAAIVAVQQEPELEDVADQFDIPVFIPERINTEDFAERLKSLTPDLFVLSGYNKILRPVIFNIPPLGTINLHGGHLPEYRGAAPINWQIIHGETIGGCAIIYVDEGIDTGDIIRQEYYRILPEDTHASVLRKTLDIFPPLLGKVLEDIQSGDVSVTPQDPLEGCYHTRRYPRDSRIHWRDMTDIQVHNLIRAMHGPYPSAFTYRGETKIEIEKSSLLDETIRGIPGRVPMSRDGSVIILAKNRGLLVEDIVVEGESVAPEKFFNLGDDLR